MSAQVNGARTPRQQTNSATTNMNVLFDLLSGEKEKAPGGVTGTGRQGEWQVQWEWGKEMACGRVACLQQLPSSPFPLFLDKLTPLSALRFAPCFCCQKFPSSYFVWRISQKYTLCGRVSVVFILYTLILLSCLLSYFD